MRYEPSDQDGEIPGGAPRGGHDERDSSPHADRAAQVRDKRDGSRGVGAEDGAISAAPGDNLDSVDDAIDAEVVDGSPRDLIRSVMAQWSGDLPHPDDAERYERIAPGTLDRLIALNERRMGVVEREIDIADSREATVRAAVNAEADVKRSLAAADTGALRRGQWLSWSISVASIGAVFFGLHLGHPQALWGLGVPIVQAGVSLVRTVTQAQQAQQERRKPQPVDEEDP